MARVDQAARCEERRLATGHGEPAPSDVSDQRLQVRRGCCCCCCCCCVFEVQLRPTFPTNGCRLEGVAVAVVFYQVCSSDQRLRPTTSRGCCWCCCCCVHQVCSSKATLAANDCKGLLLPLVPVMLLLRLSSAASSNVWPRWHL